MMFSHFRERPKEKKREKIIQNCLHLASTVASHLANHFIFHRCDNNKREIIQLHFRQSDHLSGTETER